MDTDAAKLRESFLKDLMLLQSNQTPKKLTTNQTTQHLQSSQRQQQQQQPKVRVTLLDNNSSISGQTLDARSIGCDTALNHILLGRLETPIGVHTNVLLRLNDVIAIAY